MRHPFDRKVEMGRIVNGDYWSRPFEPFGAFLVLGPCGRKMLMIVSDGMDPDPKLHGWEHVSVSVEGNHPPNWQEMCWVKDKFWNDEETVLQFHPKKSEYVNIHPNVLHLWRNVGLDHPLPPTITV